ncbi:transposable element Tcb2 transposase [Trichonephila clavipes]|nr:transposable element Tcb2 transposase [Trichonephila clavipes]
MSTFLKEAGESVCQSFLQSPPKSTRIAACKLGMSQKYVTDNHWARHRFTSVNERGIISKEEITPIYTKVPLKKNSKGYANCVALRILYAQSRLATGWLDKHSCNICVINWTPRSPDLNPIENLWYVWEQGVKDTHIAPTHFSELWTALANIWQVIPVERFQKFFESLSRREAAIIKARGGSTRY